MREKIRGKPKVCKKKYQKRRKKLLIPVCAWISSWWKWEREPAARSKKWPKKGRIQINGIVIKATDEKIDPEKDAVLLDGQPVSYAHTEYFMLNKPAGTVSATEDGKYPTVISLIGSALRKDLFPVGRLDLDTEGLLLITNDGAMAHELLSPKKHVDKIYLAYIEGTLPKDAKKQMKEGLLIEEGVKTLPAELVILPPHEGMKEGLTAVSLRIHEGKIPSGKTDV